MKPLDEYTIGEILAEVVEKFGSIRVFNKITGRRKDELYHLKRDCNHRNVDKIIKSIYDDILKYQDTKLFLNDNDRKLIRQMIWTKHRTIKGFSEKHSEFSNDYLWSEKALILGPFFELVQ